MFIGAALIELHLPGAASLKDRRRVVKGFKDRLMNRHRLAVCEVDAKDLRKRAVLLVSAVGSTQGEVTEALQAVRRLGDNLTDAECVRFASKVFGFEDAED